MTVLRKHRKFPLVIIRLPLRNALLLLLRCSDFRQRDDLAQHNKIPGVHRAPRHCCDYFPIGDRALRLHLDFPNKRDYDFKSHERLIQICGRVSSQPPNN